MLGGCCVRIRGVRRMLCENQGVLGGCCLRIRGVRRMLCENQGC